MNDNRIKLKLPGSSMETINVTAQEFCSIVTRIGAVLVSMICAWKLPELIHAVRWW